MTIEDRLNNWGREQRKKAYRQGAAASAEGMSGSDPHYMDDLPPDAYPIDTEDAQVVEYAVCALPIEQHAYLRYAYVDMEDDADICVYVGRLIGRRIHPYKDLPAAMSLAIAALTIQLSLPAVVRKQRALERIQSIREKLGLDKQDDAR